MQKISQEERDQLRNCVARAIYLWMREGDRDASTAAIDAVIDAVLSKATPPAIEWKDLSWCCRAPIAEVQNRMIVDEPTHRTDRQWVPVIVLLCTACLTQQHGDYKAHSSTISPVTSGMGRAQVYTEEQREHEIELHHGFRALRHIPKGPPDELPWSAAALRDVSATAHDLACATMFAIASMPFAEIAIADSAINAEEINSTLVEIAWGSGVTEPRILRIALRWAARALDAARESCTRATPAREVYALAEALIHTGEALP